MYGCALIQGVHASDLRYAACRVCHLLSEVESLESFKGLLMKRYGAVLAGSFCILHVVMILMYRLQLWYDKVKEEGASEGYAFASYCGFCAEIFAKIKVVLV